MRSSKDPEHFDDEDDGSLSLASSCSNSSTSSNREFCGDTVSETNVSSTKNSKSSQQESKWFDEQMDTSHSSYIVLLLLVATAIILSSIVYVVAAKQPQDQFQTKFGDASEEITQVVKVRSKGLSSNLEHLSVSFTDVAVTGNAHFPFFTMGNMEKSAGKLLDENPSIILAYAPLVSAEHRKNWETYSVVQQGMVTTDVIPESEYLTVPPRPNVSESIYRFVGDYRVSEKETAMGPFSPTWQVFPVPSGANIGVVNLNLLSDETFSRAGHSGNTVSRYVRSGKTTGSFWHPCK